MVLLDAVAGKKTIIAVNTDFERRGMDDSIRMVKVFSATMVRKREVLGERVTEWIRDNPDIHIFKTVIAQSSDQQFHCLSIVLFCGEGIAKPDDF
jgi:hypothetical protein